MAVKHRRIGLLGGSFDPVHTAHIALAETAYTRLALDEVQLLPAANPWQRAPLAASSAHRLAMLELARNGKSWLRINPSEIQRGGASYTADTLRQLPAGPEYYWLMGSDQLLNFCTWHAWREIAGRVHLVVAERPGSATQAPDALAAALRELDRQIIYLPFIPMDVSATEIRRRLADNQPVNGLLAPAVAAYIQRHCLYHDTNGTPALTV